MGHDDVGLAPIDRIVVGVDGSANSQRALRWAADLATRTQSEVIAVHAITLLERLAPDSEPVPTGPHRTQILERFENEWCSPLDNSSASSRRLALDGPPVMALLRAVEQEGAGLIVVGSRGVGGFAELLLGSTSTQLAQHAPVPVAIVPAAASERESG